jgi:hypothetical protein
MQLIYMLYILYIFMRICSEDSEYTTQNDLIQLSVAQPCQIRSKQVG